AAECLTIGRRHQAWAGREQDGVGQSRAWTNPQLAPGGRALVTRAAAISAEALARERLVHQAEDRLAKAQKRNQRAPGRHSRYERLSAIDAIKHPDVFGIGAFLPKFLADDPMMRKVPPDQRPHRGFGRVVGRRYRPNGAP